MTSPVWGLGLSSAGGKKETGGIFPFLVFRALQQIFQPLGFTFLEKNKP